MESPEFEQYLCRWCTDPSAPPLAAEFDDQAARLRHVAHGVRIDIHLPLPENDGQWRATLQCAGASTAAHPGSLALNPDDGDLWLIAIVREATGNAVLDTLETLLNQRDSYQQIANDQPLPGGAMPAGS
ncbi:hypothetical protein [Salinicola avicenniae]|uniref:hypothetical protein n=1 Tax=Salinicola avicenniae TaxID=2916836 RepID=UPI0020741CD7|nr:MULTISPECIES: hypothetical protein [unclassified Salinicola]